MKAVLPRVAKGVHLPEVFEITMNEFDVERLLPSLFYLAVTKGRPRGARVNDPTAMEEYLSSLASHPSLLGFDAPGGQRLRAVGPRERHSRGLHGQGSPKSPHRVRPAPHPTELQDRPAPAGTASARAPVRLSPASSNARGGLRADPIGRDDEHLVKRTFGQGVEIGDGPTFDEYDGDADLDVETLLTLYYLDGFQATPARAAPREPPGAPALPGLTKAMTRISWPTSAPTGTCCRSWP